ncbi:MAG: hypothetical protein V4607_08425 [Pseudomonadota bacterium]
MKRRIATLSILCLPLLLSACDSSIHPASPTDGPGELPPQHYKLTLTPGGAGSGRVVSNPAGIDCGSQCSGDFVANTTVRLGAVATSGSRFDGWGGDCSGTSDCNVSMNTARRVSAQFSAVPIARFTLSVSSSGDGAGRVTSIPAGIDCGSQCSNDFAQGTAVVLHASAGDGSNFSGWSGDCSGTSDCSLTMDQAHNAVATFNLPVTPPVTAKACTAYTGTALASLNHYEGLTHEHSAYSDGDPRFIPADYYRIGREKGYSFVAGSEHSDSLDNGNFISLHASCDPTSGHFDPTQLEYCFLNPTGDKLQKWKSTLDQAQAASSTNFLAIRGFEWTSDVFGHINVFFSKNFTNAKTDGGYLTMDTFWNWFTRDPDQIGLTGSPSSPVPFGGGGDGLASFNHPHDKCLLNDLPLPITQGLCDWNDYTLVPEAVERMFGIEAYNDSNRDDRYQTYITRALDKGWRLSFLGSEDEHFAQYAVEERPKTVTLAKSLSTADFKQAWLARRTYALTPGQHVRIDFDADGHPMGDKMACDTGAKIPLTVKTRNPDGTDFKGSLQLFSNGGELIAKLDQASGVFQVPVKTGERWYFVRVHGVDGKSVAYVAPVWIKGK